MVADENLVSERLAGRWNPRQPRQMYRLNMSMGEPIKPILPVNYADLPAYIPVWVQQMEERQDHMMGVRDLVAMAKARQIPSEGTIEKILEMAGPLAQDMTRNMERGMRDLGEFRRYLNLQFRTVKRQLQILGEGGVPAEVFDWDPGSMIPSHLEDEDPERGPSRVLGSGTRPEARGELRVLRRAEFHGPDAADESETAVTATGKSGVSRSIRGPKPNSTKSTISVRRPKARTTSLSGGLPGSTFCLSFRPKALRRRKPLRRMLGQVERPRRHADARMRIGERHASYKRMVGHVRRCPRLDMKGQRSRSRRRAALLSRARD